MNKLFNKWMEMLLGEREIDYLSFLHLKRAFETIDRARSINKLIAIGFGGKEIDWFISYLNGREQQTKIDDHISSKRQNDYGVPQGAVLASTLFSIYINDICEIIKDIENSNINLFADDTEIHIIVDDMNEGIRIMNLILIRLENYFKLNKLKINANKTKGMVVKNKHKQICRPK